MRCEPLGLARLITFSGIGAAMEFVQTHDRLLQLFEWTWDFRDIWMDGRKPPKVEDYLPRFNGYSVGHWEGDTLVVTSTGFDDRQWLDQYGFPISEEAVLEERWDRPSPNRLRVCLTLRDPATYTAPWESSPKVWALIPKKDMAIGGWSGILEDRCVPSDESLFNRFRDRAAGLPVDVDSSSRKQKPLSRQCRPAVSASARPLRSTLGRAMNQANPKSGGNRTTTTAAQAEYTGR